MGRKGFNVDGIALDSLTVDGDYVDAPDSAGFHFGAPSEWPEDMPWAGFAADDDMSDEGDE